MTNVTFMDILALLKDATVATDGFVYHGNQNCTNANARICKNDNIVEIHTCNGFYLGDDKLSYGKKWMIDFTDQHDLTVTKILDDDTLERVNTRQTAVCDIIPGEMMIDLIDFATDLIKQYMTQDQAVITIKDEMRKAYEIANNAYMHSTDRIFATAVINDNNPDDLEQGTLAFGIIKEFLEEIIPGIKIEMLN